MTAGGGGSRAGAGGPAPHIPVLGRRVVEYLAPKPDNLYIDATFGAGGYSRALLDAGARVIGIDRDRTAITAGYALVQESAGRLTLVEDQFSNLEAAAGGQKADGVVFDLGVSSMQLDRAERGFSFRHDGPLDMRMGGDGPSAADLIAAASERDLASVIAILGEERHARAVARAIVKDRAGNPFTTTLQLAELVARVVRHKPTEIHPATRTFQALRIFINDELGELTAALGAAERVLKPGGRLVAVSFHSLEDRIVKTFLADRGKSPAGSRHAPETQPRTPTFQALTKKPVVADEHEIAANPRARSAKLRAAERTSAPARNAMPELLPSLPSLDAVMKGR
ncbi:MAG: 16S rRNA (cytosine(1402)-N(4))-methyltransferase RsmH [Pseudolabrys sp.]|nr:16S rRNA (cytosine(1402)-N(4))-methyltransferase RsmH [Pseudolabrys sp.]